MSTEFKQRRNQPKLKFVPCDWEETTIGAVTTWLSGGTPSRKIASFWTGSIPWISGSTLKNIEISSSDQFLTPDAVISGSKMAPLNSTLLLVRGSALHNEIRAGVVVAPVAFNQDVKSLIPRNDVHPKYLSYYILGMSEELLKLVSSAGNSAGVLDTNLVQDFGFLKPSLEEQSKIVSALTDMDDLISGLDQLIAKKRDIQQATMQQLLTGQRRLPGFSGKWEVKKLGDIASLNRINVIPFTTPDKTFTHFSLPAFDEGKRPVKEVGVEIGSNKFSVPANAILVSKLNPRIPRVWLPQDIPDNAVASTEFLVLTPRDGIAREFLYVVCRSSSFCAQMELAATGTTGSHQRISPGSALSLSVSVPSEKFEQSAIATILFDMDAELAALETRRDKARQLKQGMMQELLTGKTRLL